MIKRRNTYIQLVNTIILISFSLLTIILFRRFSFHSNKGFKFAMKLLLSGYHTSTKMHRKKLYNLLEFLLRKRTISLIPRTIRMNDSV